MSERAPVAPSTDRFLTAIVVGAVLLLVVAVGAVALLARAPRPAPADPAAPVGVVQAYVEALRAGDLDRAHSYLSRSAQAAVPLATYRERFPRYGESSRNETRLLIEPVTVGADTAEVKVTVSRFTARSEPFSANAYHRDVTVRLVREDGAWRVSQPIEPYAFS